MFKSIGAFFLSFIMLAWVSAAQAYVGLCCAHCGGNMPLNIFGGGIPETKEFRFKISQMIMEMGPLRDGTDDIETSSIVGAASASGATFPAVPKSMRQYMTMFGGAYSFSDNFVKLSFQPSYIINKSGCNFLYSVLTLYASSNELAALTPALIISILLNFSS